MLPPADGFGIPTLRPRVLQPWLFEKPEEPVMHAADDEVSECSVQRYTECDFDLP
jgi:hypothetical protein